MEITLTKRKSLQTIPFPNKATCVLINDCVFEDTQIEKIEITFSNALNPISSVNSTILTKKQCADYAQPLPFLPKHPLIKFTHVSFQVEHHDIGEGQVKLNVAFDVKSGLHNKA